ncbi:phosphoenolpyruvate--protein phosphotransferase [Brachyspira hampsonii]|uniref:Phosphoenolpyruvate-protein phosphotransferase n=1 Tax=Brachyspira hampsonii TaxID=1287055 RepID=A0AAC9XL76_9SPIR|nr:phosphoenolpyruvate--protein phosphotransferase [Brachyspira hampsonii]ASJ22226.1 phosphoenolpyruvate--protein phosphotransferase [Brachyspira hampsonii]ELV06873.1 PTS system transporter phosphoenolpyruvate-protein kinase EI [Brachyspira hampsonii 30599]MBW5380916.1 phosphoenolpyruvate--protein phosphotransferase [Brachyspira hampsonii]MBW5410006.1 phosphoenolpyruvate--protein phosphotransferase [Brachyspira hampsonii]OEJ19074.1 phosphoenolpyruvate--protein phosphotransferase [Brachyspira h
MPDKRTILNGNGVGDDVAIGNSFFYTPYLNTPIYKIEESDIEEEYKRFDEAVKKSINEIELLQNHADNNIKNILHTHILMLQDRVIIKQVKEEVKEKLLNIEHVYDTIISGYLYKLSSINNKMLSERSSDIIDIKSRLIRNLIQPHSGDYSKVPKDSIVIAKTLTPSDVLKFNAIGVAGFIIESGGYTSHAAILAKSFGITTIFNIADISSKIKNGRKIIIDCKSNIVIMNPSERDIYNYTILTENIKKLKEKAISDAKEKALTKDNIEIKVHANIDIPEETESLLKFGVDSIGLYRTEFLYIFSDEEIASELPTEETQFQVYKTIASKIKGKVIIRTLDIGGDKISPALGLELKEDNPFLGWRAIRFCLSNKQLFKNQIKALLRASHYGNIEIMIPMISTLEEFIETKNFIEDIKKELRDENQNFNEEIKIGVLIETPSAAAIIDLIVKEADFLSIGSNDLVQYMMACDRTNEKLIYLYNPIDISVLRTLKRVIKIANENNKPVTLCGEMGGVPEYTPVLLGLGIRELSMSVTSIAKIKNIVRNISIEECEDLVNKMLDKCDNNFSRSILKDFLRKKYKIN